MILIPRITFATVLLFGFYTATAQKAVFSLSSGYQSEDFRWSIAGNTMGTNPNIYSELKWNNLAGPVLGAEVDWNVWKQFHIHSTFSRLFIVSGKVTDMDYQGDDRTLRSYYGAFDANKGMSFSWRTTLEYSWQVSTRLTLIPCLGYALHRQYLYLLSSDQTGAAAGLRSTYATRYEGAVLGLRGKISSSGHISLEGGLLYDIVHYRGTADWNLIPTFQHPLSFEDQANGYNLEGNVRMYYSFDKKWSLFLNVDVLHSKTGTGTDWLYLQTGPGVPTQFNGAVRDYIRTGIGIKLALY